MDQAPGPIMAKVAAKVARTKGIQGSPPPEKQNPQFAARNECANYRGPQAEKKKDRRADVHDEWADGCNLHCVTQVRDRIAHQRGGNHKALEHQARTGQAVGEG